MFYIVLGCFLDGISMVVLTMGVILPTVEKAGIDLLWFGIFIVLVVEMAQITPPVGFNLFVLQGMTGRRDHVDRPATHCRCSISMIVATLLLLLFPGAGHVSAAPDEVRLSADAPYRRSTCPARRNSRPSSEHRSRCWAYRVSGSALTGVEYLPLSERAMATDQCALAAAGMPPDRALSR